MADGVDDALNRGFAICPAIVVVGLRVLGRLPTGGTEVSSALWLHGGRMEWIPSVARGLLSIVTVGMGVSLGREAAPQLFGAATASKVSVWADLPTGATIVCTFGTVLVLMAALKSAYFILRRRDRAARSEMHESISAR